MPPPKPRLLVNLPSGFYRTSAIASRWAELSASFEVRQTSHDTADQIAADLAWAQSVLMWSWPALTDELRDVASDLKFAAHIDLTQRAANAALLHGLPVSVSRSGFSPAVAELALALILGALRRISD